MPPRAEECSILSAHAGEILTISDARKRMKSAERNVNRGVTNLRSLHCIPEAKFLHRQCLSGVTDAPLNFSATLRTSSPHSSRQGLILSFPLLGESSLAWRNASRCHPPCQPALTLAPTSARPKRRSNSPLILPDATNRFAASVAIVRNGFPPSRKTAGLSIPLERRRLENPQTCARPGDAPL